MYCFKLNTQIQTGWWGGGGRCKAKLVTVIALYCSLEDKKILRRGLFSLFLLSRGFPINQPHDISLHIYVPDYMGHAKLPQFIHIMYYYRIFEWDPYMTISNVILCVISSAHYSLIEESSVFISSDDMNLTRYQSYSGPIEWTFNTSYTNRIVITFHVFDLWVGYDFLVIGDGLDIKESTIIAKFSGNTRPNDVLTIGNAAWIRLIYSRTIQENKEPEFTMNVSDTTRPGIGFLLYSSLITKSDCSNLTLHRFEVTNTNSYLMSFI